MIQISFGYSSSQNYLLALTMAAKASEFHWTGEDKAIRYQCDYGFLDLHKAVKLWDLVGGWKSASFKIDGQELDQGGIGRVSSMTAGRTEGTCPSPRPIAALPTFDGMKPRTRSSARYPGVDTRAS